MATKSNVSGSVFETVDPAFTAGRISIWPHQSHGGYRYAGFSGLLPAALAANAETFQMRWSSATDLFVLKFLKVRYQVITGFTAAQELAFDAVQSTGFTVAGTGGTAITPAATTLKKRQSIAISKVSDMRIATTAALGVGTKTLSANSFLVGMGKALAVGATVQDAVFEETLDLTHSGDDPIVFAQNEGFSIRNTIALGAGGTVRMAVQLAWTEYLNAGYPTL